MNSMIYLSFVLIALISNSFTLPIFDSTTSTPFSVHLVDGHLPRSFTNEFEMFTSTSFTPLLKERSLVTEEMMKKENKEESEENVQTTTAVQQDRSEEEKEEKERSARAFEENSTMEPEEFSTEKSIVRVTPMDETKDLQTSTMTSRTSSKKFSGHFEDEEHKKKSSKKLSKTFEEEEKDQGESIEESTKSSAPLAEYDPTIFDSISTPVGNHLQFDENHQSIPELFEETTVGEERKTRESEESHEKDTTTRKTSRTSKKAEERVTKDQLNQGSTLLLFILAAFLFCACLLASTLAFVKTRQSLKRKSRIIEMEAHLDDHYLHYHPLLFQQHFHK